MKPPHQIFAFVFASVWSQALWFWRRGCSTGGWTCEVMFSGFPVFHVVSSPLFVTQFKETCSSTIMNMCSPTLNTADVYTFLSIHNFHLLIIVIWRHIFCIQERHAVLSMRRTPVTLRHVNEHNSDPSSGRSLKFSPVVQDSLMNWTLFSLNSYISLK